MMRVAGRNKSGLAKGLSVEDSGALNTLTENSVILNMTNFTDGVSIQPNAYWDSAVHENKTFNSKNFTHLHVRTFIDGVHNYSVQIFEILRTDSGTAVVGRNTVILDTVNENKSTIFKIDYAEFKIRIYNRSAETKKIGVYAYLKNHLDENLTVGDLEKTANFNEYIYNKPTPLTGLTISANTYWDSAINESKVFNSKNFTHLHIQTFLNSKFKYSVELIEVLKNQSGVGIEGRRTLAIDDAIGNQSIIFKIEYAEFKIRIYNKSEASQKIGLYAYLKDDDSNLSVVNHNQHSSLLKNVRLYKNNMIPHDFYNGEFYAHKHYSNEVHTSEDGVNWTLKATLPTADRITVLIVSDTGRIIAGTVQGNVYVSDENQEFSSSEPVVSSGKFDVRFGATKYQNVILLNNYDLHGPDYEHDVFLSTDNGESFKKIFGNENIASFGTTDDRYHIHASEYDPYNGKIYVWLGDFTNINLFISDDWGKTWTTSMERGLMSNHTQIIAVEKGIVLGADTEQSGISFIELKRESFDEAISEDKYIRNFYKFTDNNERWIATRPFVDRANNVYIMGYTAEYSNRAGYVLYSKDGYNWSMILKTQTAGSYFGIVTSVYGNGKVVLGQRNDDIDGTVYQTIVADANF